MIASRSSWFRLSSHWKATRVYWPYVCAVACSFPKESFSVVFVHVFSSSPASIQSLVGSLCRGPHERRGLLGPLVHDPYQESGNHGSKTATCLWCDPTTNRKVHKKEACQSTNLNRRPRRWRLEADSQQVDWCRPASRLPSVKPGLLGVFPIFSSFHRSSQLLLFRIRVCSLGFSDKEKRVVLDRCCPGLLVSVWYVFGDFICSVPRVHAEPRRLGHPRTGFSGTPLLLFVCCWTQSYAVSVTTSAQGAERLP